MSRKSSRRQFLKQSAILSATPFIGTVARPVLGASDKVHIACVGVGGKGESDMIETSVGHEVVAICDVDQRMLDNAARRYPNAKRYTDWRKMLEQKDIDAVTVSTADHTHAPVSMSAMSLGKHVYTQKPLTHTVYEARQLAIAAKKHGVVTQMGIQHHASARLKMAVKAIQDGVIGKVSEAHSWTDRPGNYWQQGMKRPENSSPVPGYLAWDQWLGTAPERPYVDGVYHAFRWRGWWDFGTGVVGDMACHLLDPVFNALQLPAPSVVTAEGPPPNPESGPEWSIMHWEFPGTAHTTPTFKLHWYEAGKQPPREIFKAPANWAGSLNGVLFVGQKGNLFVGFPENPELFPVEDFKGYKFPEMQDHNHYLEWTNAILGNGKPSCPFAYSGPLTEMALLGNVAYRTGKKIVWDSAALKAQGVPEADALIRRAYRKGWEVPGLS